MKSVPHIHLTDLQALYAGPGGRRWDPLIREQIRLGEMASSMELAEGGG